MSAKTEIIIIIIIIISLLRQLSKRNRDNE